jgi:hypothetical protein
MPFVERSSTVWMNTIGSLAGRANHCTGNGAGGGESLSLRRSSRKIVDLKLERDVRVVQQGRSTIAKLR